jgi:hypothetical protein
MPKGWQCQKVQGCSRESRIPYVLMCRSKFSQAFPLTHLLFLTDPSVFSTSKDHNQGNNAMAGCILIDFEKMQVINRSPAYRNQYVHRRDSVSIAMLSEAEIKERVQLGLIEGYTAEDAPDECEEEAWEEFDEDELNTSREDLDSSLEEEEEYVVDERRKSSVDPNRTMSSPEGTKDRNVFMVDDSEMPSKKIDFDGVDTTMRRKKRDKGKFDSIAEENGDSDEDEESTVDGEDDDHTVDPLETENYERGTSTSMSPALKKFSF